MKKSKLYIFLPFIIGLSIAAGIYLGYFYTRNAVNKPAISSNPYAKLDLLLETINSQYVDSVDIEDIIEHAIPAIVSELDPHSKYIPAQKLEAVNRELEGSFGGIGVAFIMCDDTITVTDIVKGGPSEKTGLRQFDRIVKINDTTFTGSKINSYEVMNKLRGKKGTDVGIGIKRKSNDYLLPFTITRGDIPENSVDVSYKVSGDIGYIKVDRFAINTYQEFLLAIAKLKSQKCNSFIIDFRGNLGGYMDAAINMANEFLKKGQSIVITEGKSLPRQEYKANGNGSCQDSPIIVLIDQESASASEIFAGAIQDNDRGVIIGRRSFGKALIQQQPGFSDGSALRLTVGRYYAPSGRSIQKPFEKGKSKEYEEEIWMRYQRGEFNSQDSIKLYDSLRYVTLHGRNVYGGGGIVPDIFVPIDTTSHYTSYSEAVMSKGLIPGFAIRYTEAHLDSLKEYRHYWPLLQHLNEQDLLEKFVQYAEQRGVKRRPYAIDVSGYMIETSIKAQIAQLVIGREAFYPIIYQLDEVYKKAVREMKEMKDPILLMQPELSILPKQNDEQQFSEQKMSIKHPYTIDISKRLIEATIKAQLS